MDYREGRATDYPALTKLLSTSGYYAPVNTAEIGGTWIVAEREGKIVGCIWAFYDGPQAYVDYYYVDPDCRKSKVTVRLIAAMAVHLKMNGVRYTRGVIRSDNLDASRLFEAVGVLVDHGYGLAYMEL